MRVEFCLSVELCPLLGCHTVMLTVMLELLFHAAVC